MKNTVLHNITIESMAAEGKCVARHEGRVIFVPRVAPGDIADLKVIRKKKSFLDAIPVKIHTYSKDREAPFCEHFGTCGGCKWQHINYETQLHYKQRQVVDSFERLAKVPVPVILPILPSENTIYYRNKLEFTFSNKRWLTREEINSEEKPDKNALGFHIPGRFDKILEINHCYLQPDPSNAIRLAVEDFAKAQQIPFFDLITQQGYLRNLIIRTTSGGELMVILQVAQDDSDILDKVMSFLIERFPDITSLNYIINNKKNDAYHDLEAVTYHGQPYITEEMNLPASLGEKVKFQIGPKSFFQTNAAQASVLYKKTWELAGLTGEELVFDLYTGTGTIASYIARDAKKVIGIEYVAAAIEDAKVNAAINNITNMEFYAGDMKDLLNDSFIQKHGRPDVVITDPPRAGMHADVCEVLLNAAPRKIVYVSCNPATQARDIALLDQKYKVTALQPIDMFPHTHHVENIALLELKGI